MIKCLISEHSLNRNLRSIFPNPIKFRRHLTIIDYLSQYINGIYNGDGISQIKISKVNSDFEDPIITEISYDIEKFKNNLKTIIPYIEFKHSDFILATNSKIKDVELKRVFEYFSTTPMIFNFPVCLASKNSCGFPVNKIKKHEFKKQIKGETILKQFEYIKHGKFDCKYKIELDTNFMLYLINNVIMKHSSIIPIEMYNCVHIPTASQLFMRRFIYSNGYKKTGPRTIKLKYDTIRWETGFNKTDSYIRSNMLRPLVESKFIKTLYNSKRGVIKIEFIKRGPYILRFQNKF